MASVTSYGIQVLWEYLLSAQLEKLDRIKSVFKTRYENVPLIVG